MRVVIIHKISNYELHGARTEEYVRAGVFAPASLVRLKGAHEEHYQTLAVLFQLLTDRGIKYLSLNRAKSWPEPPEAFNYIITVGGDGTLLSASHYLANGGKVIGVRSSEASVGALCAYDFQTMESFCDDLAAEQISFVTTTRLRAQVKRAADGITVRSLPVLNDFLYANVSPAATTRYRVRLNDRVETQKSSGIWVSTPTGSTAAIMAAGGTVLQRHERQCQYRTRELFFPPNTSYQLQGGLFDPDSELLEIENRTEKALLALDGQHGELRLGFGDRIQFLRAPSLELACSPKDK